MNRRLQRFCTWLLLCSVVFTGCAPVQPFYLNNDRDLSHYLDTATDIEYPDIVHDTLADAEFSQRPRTIAHPDYDSIWDLTLEEAMATALQNSKVIRSFGQVRQFGQIIGGPAERLSTSPDGVLTIYDTAILETGQNGVEQALSAFDAIFNSNATWDRRDRPQNLVGFGLIDQQDRVVFNNEIQKRAATGSQFTVRNQTIYTDDNDQNNNRAQDTNWTTSLETEVRQPLLRGAGTQVNRIPVVLARIRTDISLAAFELGVRNMMNEVETAYWELYFFYRNVETSKIGRDSALATWKKIHALYVEEARGGEAQQEAQAREQYFFFRSRVEEALRDLYKSETRLRFLMGLAATDGRLIRPADEPTRARVTFDWNDIHSEALTRSVELRGHQWRVKQRELELIASRNQLLPQLDAVGIYRWFGQGDRLTGNQTNFPAEGSGAVDEMFEGRFQEGQLGFQMSVPLGFRREMAQVRNSQLLLARSRARLEDAELEVSHQLSDAVADLDAQGMLAQTHLNRRVAAGREVDAMEAAYDTGTVTLDRLLDAQRRRADAEIAYYRSLVEYSLSIILVHLRKGSLLDYNSVVLAEGPWPNKAYFDSLQRARRRDSSYIADYGYSRPRVVSKGAVPQLPGPTGSTEQSVEVIGEGDVIFDGESGSLEPTPLDDIMPLEEVSPPQEATQPKAIDAPVDKMPLEPYIPSPLESLPVDPAPGTEYGPSDQATPPLFDLRPSPERAEPESIETKSPRAFKAAKRRRTVGKTVTQTGEESSVIQASHIEFLSASQARPKKRLGKSRAEKAKEGFSIVDPADSDDDGAHVEMRWK